MYSLWSPVEYRCRWVAKFPFFDEFAWTNGQRHVHPIPDPIEVKLKPLDPRSADHGPDMPESFLGRVPLFRDDFLAAAREAGADNIDSYNAVVVDPDAGRRHTNYKAVNVIGQLPRAVFKNLQPDEFIIDGAKFSQEKARELNKPGRLIFRVEEAIGLFVHQRLKDHLLQRGFTRICLLDPGKTAL